MSDPQTSPSPPASASLGPDSGCCLLLAGAGALASLVGLASLSSASREGANLFALVGIALPGLLALTGGVGGLVKSPRGKPLVLSMTSGCTGYLGGGLIVTLLGLADRSLSTIAVVALALALLTLISLAYALEGLAGSSRKTRVLATVWALLILAMVVGCTRKFALDAFPKRPEPLPPPVEVEAPDPEVPGG